MLTWLSWENPVAFWWVFLSFISIVNMVVWVWTWYYFGYRDHSVASLRKFWSEPRNIIWFSFFYVFVCAFRSIFPRADVQRICLHDTWFSSVLVGRSFATVAELAFIIQWVIILRLVSKQAQVNLASKISYIIFPLIAAAECFSWYAVITTHYLGNSIEESLWGVSYTLITIALLSLWPKLKGPLKLAAGFATFGCLMYVAFMSTVDVPMYIGRLISDSANGKTYFGLFEGLHDLNTRWVVTHDIHDWKTEIPWQTLYFSFGVWVSLALCYVPLDSERLKKYLR